jgi:hypothetical protein
MGVCKFDQSQTDQDNFELVRRNIEYLYKNALKYGKLSVIPSTINQGLRVERVGDGELKERFAKLTGGPS